MTGAVLRLDNTKVGDTYTVEVPTYDAEGNPVLDDENNPVTTPETRYTGGIINSVFSNNTSTLTGSKSNVLNNTSALRLDNSEISQIVGSKFNNNSNKFTAQTTQGYGIGLYSNNSTIHQILNTEFIGNTTTSGYRPQGIAALFTGGTVVDSFKDSVVKDNKGTGANYTFATVQVVGSSLIKEIDNVLFENNNVSYAGALSVSTGRIGTINKTTFKNNTSYYDGGALRVANASSFVDLIQDSVFDGNKVTNSYGGGAISLCSNGNRITRIENTKFLNNSATGVNEVARGGAIRGADNTTINSIVNSTFEGNRAINTNSSANGGAIGAQRCNNF